MKKFFIISILFLSSCGSIKDMIPSRWDANQSRVVTDLRQDVRHFDCNSELNNQLENLNQKIEWFHLYSESKNTVDVDKLMEPMQITLKEFSDRSNKGPVSSIYCDLKKKIMTSQIDIIAKTVQGRF